MSYSKPRPHRSKFREVRRASLVETLERRSLLSTTVIGKGGATLGSLSTYVPAGGVFTLPASATVTTKGRGTSAGDPGFQITLVFTGGLTASQMAIFTQSAAKWQSILTGDIPDVNSTNYGFIDDVRIEASGVAIDGVGNILGQAGPTEIRNGSALPDAGVMQFDTADLANIESQGLLDEVITHEMGHVLGLGTIWPTLGLITGAGGTDPRFTGANATAEYNALAGLTSSTGVPVANSGGSGTRDSHWRETGAGGTALGNELMTGVINSSQNNPLSRISAAQMQDLGYPLVNIDAGDLYTVPINPGNGGSSGDFSATNPLPVISALTPSTATPGTNSSFDLNLTTATDNASVASISFYRESNGIPGLQAVGSVAHDTLVTTVSGSTLSTTVSTSGLVAGSYTFYARAADNFGALSATSSTTVTVSAVVAPGVPSVPALAAGFDTGDSSSDGITKLNVLTFVGTATAGATITLKNGTTTIGTGSADSSGNYTVTTSALANGTYAVTATASNSAGTSTASTARSITVDTIAPAVVATAYDREVTQGITLTLGEALASRLTTGSVTLTNTTTNTVVPITSVTYSGGTTATFKAAGLLANGNYVLTLPAANLTDVAGNALTAAATVSFRQLNGDANNDGTVNFSDLVILAQNYNQSGKTFSQGNLNYSAGGLVDFSDLVILAQNYNTSLPAAILAAATGSEVAGSTSGLKAKNSRAAATAGLV